MSKTSVEIDDKLLSRATEILGTKSKRETINSSLLEVVNSERRRNILKWAEELGGLGPPPEKLRKMRSPGHRLK